MQQIDNNLNRGICITNLIDKTNNIYVDKKLINVYVNKKSVVYPRDWFHIINDIINLIYYYVKLERYNTSRIEFSLDDNLIRKYNLPFDQISICVYRDGKNTKFQSNYMYTDIDGYRNFMVDLYFTNYELLTGYYMRYMIEQCILTEMNNCFNRDIYKQ